jgi:alpha-tubulin suppressor-like RCC1 family protein
VNGQQFASQSTIPSSSVAATTPKMSAPRRLGALKFMWFGVVGAGRVAGVIAIAAMVASCTEPIASPLRFPLLEDDAKGDWASVSVGADHSCALKTNGNVYCWGSNRFGQLGVPRNDTLCGTGTGKYGCSLRPQLVQSSVQFTSVSAGQRHTCAITTQREAFCWGANDQNQLGGFAGSGSTPVRVQGALPWTQISAGFTHSCAVRSDGALFCWGQSERGQLGNGSLFNASLPARVALSEPAASVSAGQGRTCARTTVGRVYCWGAIWTTRESGLELSRSQTTPLLVPGSPSMATVTVGSFTTCGADFTGFAYCWEANPRGEIGDGTTEGSVTPKRVVGDLEFVHLSAGIVQTCGVTTNGSGYCWGDDSFGQLGVPFSLLIERCAGGTLPCTTRPVPVIGRQSFVEISTGFGSHTCGVTTRGNLYCWGLGQSGQRGDGTMAAPGFTPLRVVEPGSESRL